MRIIWTPAALQNLKSIRRYLLQEADVETMASEALRILDSLERLRSFPESGRPGRVSGTREIVASPYIIPYRVVDNRVQVLNVFHSSMDAARGPSGGSPTT